MLFNSYEFIFIFLPIVFIVYFFVLKNSERKYKMFWLVLASLFFYGFWNPKYLILILFSIVINYCLNKFMYKFPSLKKSILIIGILFNVLLLGYYKYTNFLVDNVNLVFGTNIAIEQIILPLAISFFTFEQIAFIIDSYKGETKEYSFAKHILFVSYFPKLIAGPIVYYHEIIPQLTKDKVEIKNVSLGIYIFIIGLAKKVLIADNFAILANNGFGSESPLMFFSSWITSLAYTFQLYFDFSGYCDMAMGASLLFNIKLQLNFNSPYKALNIADFWRRWHMTLNRFLTHYIYFPLGGSRLGELRTYMNIFIIFFISGVWHGAGWTFVIWGIMHGLASILYRTWKKTSIKLPRFLSWFITFQFVNMAWVFFRAENVGQALSILKGMVGLNGMEFPSIAAKIFDLFHVMINTQGILLYDSKQIISYLLIIFVFFILILFTKNSFELMEEFKLNITKVIFLAFISVASILSLSKVSVFLYFNF